MTRTPKQLDRTAAHAYRALVRRADVCLSERGRKIPAVTTLGISKAQVDPGKATGVRYEPLLYSYLWPLACGLAPSHEGQESELIISPIQLLSCGGRERRVPLKSKEDSENAVGIAPMALPLDLAMEVGTPGREPSS
jgi:hypothetical protein